MLKMVRKIVFILFIFFAIYGVHSFIVIKDSTIEEQRERINELLFEKEYTEFLLEENLKEG